MISFSIIKPDDMHVHLRDGAILNEVVKDTARQFARAVVMPNLVPPVTTTELALAYKSRIVAPGFEPLMTLYLTDNTPTSEIEKAKAAGIIGAKLYPAGATTNSDSGVTDVEKIYPVFEAMQKHALPLLIHGEVTHKEVDVFDREFAFIEETLIPIRQNFPNLKIVFEHITTQDAVLFVRETKNTFATITAHHLLFNRNEIFKGGVRPHYYCLPVLKREEHRQALLGAALSGSKKFFAGTDSAPHLKHKKENSCGCAGCYTSPIAVELYAQAFDSADLANLETQKKFENFMSRYGADFYGLPYNSEKITLTKTPQKVAEKIETPEGEIIPLLAGEEIEWKLDV